MRYNLIMQLYCSNCGNQLEAKYDKEDMPMQKEAIGLDKLPTGADCRYIKTYIKPCQHCIRKKTAPAQKIIDGIRAMQGDL